MVESTIGGPRHVVLPFKAPMSGPNSLLAMITSHGVTGQLGRLLALRILMKFPCPDCPEVVIICRILVVSLTVFTAKTCPWHCAPCEQVMSR